ncbi:hypothetical protein PAXINDRAFT_171536 [Paxillus involutus ATCC 200175]|uniref:Uncharacterized protein n=1 Tax=Paxillus involutus ATCC 200175 TaxID=664439 RepID=A0A0C9TVZ5_PAXIN|nr:hypothetical protein PAXINDRAFT_171536 [Paxillus involutus ATCC 200175]
MQERRFWKSHVRTPVSDVAAGRLTDRVKVGRREPRNTKNDVESRKPQKSRTQRFANSALFAHHSGSTSSAARASSFTQSNAGSDDGWDDTDCGKQCVDYFCLGPREDRERFRPWRKRSRAVIETEEQAKKNKTTKNAPRHRQSKAPKTQNAIRPRHHLDPQRTISKRLPLSPMTLTIWQQSTSTKDRRVTI